MVKILIPHIRRSSFLSAPLAGLMSAVIAGGTLIGTLPASAQAVPAGAATGETVVQGRILDRFGDRLLIEGLAGRILVDVQAVPGQAADLAPGQAVVVEGMLSTRVLQARRIAAAEGRTPTVGSPVVPPPASVATGAPMTPPTGSEAQLVSRIPLEAGAVDATLQAAGFAVIGAPVRDGKDTQVAVRDSQGRGWTASLDRFGRLGEAELADYDDDDVPERPGFAAQEVIQTVAREGFQARGPVERHHDHFEILALNRRSELIELHVDFAGQIYKQVWVR